MPRDRIGDLFKSYAPAIQQIVAEVGKLEQRHISMERPRVKGQIDDIITRVAKQELGRDETEEDSQE